MTQLESARDAMIVPLQAVGRKRFRRPDSERVPMGQVLLFTGVRYERLENAVAVDVPVDCEPAAGAAGPVSTDH